MFPKKIKFSKYQKGVLHSNKSFKSKNKMSLFAFGTLGLISQEEGRFSSNQILTGQRQLKKKLNKQGKIWTLVFPSVPVTKKAAGSRMGKGKGSVSYWVCKVYPGIMLYEISGVSELLGLEALRMVSKLFPFKTKVIVKEQSR